LAVRAAQRPEPLSPQARRQLGVAVVIDTLIIGTIGALFFAVH
jgi:hypothetical protein